MVCINGWIKCSVDSGSTKRTSVTSTQDIGYVDDLFESYSMLKDRIYSEDVLELLNPDFVRKAINDIQSIYDMKYKCYEKIIQYGEIDANFTPVVNDLVNRIIKKENIGHNEDKYFREIVRLFEKHKRYSNALEFDFLALDLAFDSFERITENIFGSEFQNGVYNLKEDSDDYIFAIMLLNNLFVEARSIKLCFGPKCVIDERKFHSLILHLKSFEDYGNILFSSLNTKISLLNIGKERAIKYYGTFNMILNGTRILMSLFNNNIDFKILYEDLLNYNKDRFITLLLPEVLNQPNFFEIIKTKMMAEEKESSTWFNKIKGLINWIAPRTNSMYLDEYVVIDSNIIKSIGENAIMNTRKCVDENNNSHGIPTFDNSSLEFDHPLHNDDSDMKIIYGVPVNTLNTDKVDKKGTINKSDDSPKTRS